MVFPYTVTYSASTSAVDINPPVPQTGPRGKWRCSDTTCSCLIHAALPWRPPSLGSRKSSASELLEASWDGPESELEMNADATAACSRYPDNPELRRAFFFFLGGTGIPPSTGRPDGAVTQLKLEGRRGGEYLLRSWLENKIMQNSCCFEKQFCC